MPCKVHCSAPFPPSGSHWTGAQQVRAWAVVWASCGVSTRYARHVALCTTAGFDSAPGFVPTPPPPPAAPVPSLCFPRCLWRPSRAPWAPAGSLCTPLFWLHSVCPLVWFFYRGGMRGAVCSGASHPTSGQWLLWASTMRSKWAWVMQHLIWSGLGLVLGRSFWSYFPSCLQGHGAQQVPFWARARAVRGVGRWGRWVRCNLRSNRCCCLPTGAFLPLCSASLRPPSDGGRFCFVVPVSCTPTLGVRWAPSLLLLS